MSTKHDHHIDDDDGCELHRWHEIAELNCLGKGDLAIVTTDNLAKLDGWFQALLWSPIRRHRPAIEQVDLPDPAYYSSPAVMVYPAQEDPLRVWARFCDPYCEGHMSVCEIRIEVHRHDEDDTEP